MSTGAVRLRRFAALSTPPYPCSAMTLAIACRATMPEFARVGSADTACRCLVIPSPAAFLPMPPTYNSDMCSALCHVNTQYDLQCHLSRAADGGNQVDCLLGGGSCGNGRRPQGFCLPITAGNALARWFGRAAAKWYAILPSAERATNERRKGALCELLAPVRALPLLIRRMVQRLNPPRFGPTTVPRQAAGSPRRQQLPLILRR